MASGDTMALATNIPLPSTSDDSSFFREPRAPYMASVPFTSDSPRESYLNATPNDSGTMLATKNENSAVDPSLTTTPPKSKRRFVIVVLLFLLALSLVIVAVIVPVYFTVIKPKLNRSSGANGGSSSPTTSSGGGQSGQSGSTPSSPANIITGGDGSTIHAADCKYRKLL